MLIRRHVHTLHVLRHRACLSEVQLSSVYLLQVKVKRVGVQVRAAVCFHFDPYLLKAQTSLRATFTPTHHDNKTLLNHPTIDMAPLGSSYCMRPDERNPYPSEPHFKDTARACACDHCSYFKGIVYRIAVRQQLTGDEELAVRNKNLAAGPRSLESVALAEEAVEQREHAKYMAYSQSQGALRDASSTAALRMKAQNTDLYIEQSDTLTRWIETSTKEELLSWLEKRGNERDDMDELRQEGIFDLRDYILHSRHAQKTPKNPKAASHSSRSCAKPSQQSPPPEVKKRNVRAIVAGLRVQAHESLKPPQAALRQREELRRWYDCRKVPDLKDECRQRKIRPVPATKVALVAVLVEDDKKSG